MFHQGLGALAERYDVVLCDIWGVLHDGVSPHKDAAEALTRFRQGGGAVVLVSNAPRPAMKVIEQLDKLGVSRRAWDGIVTSGDVTTYLLDARGVRRVNHIGPPRDEPLFDRLHVDLVAGDEAEIVVVTGLFDDETEHPSDYKTSLARLAERQLPLICANPDRVVERGDKLVWCAGALADLYAEFGGEIIETGKPHAMIYDFALSTAAAVRRQPVDRRRVLAVGDALRTDMMGADRMGLATLFVAHGIHIEEVGNPLDQDKTVALLAGMGTPPVAVMPRLAW